MYLDWETHAPDTYVVDIETDDLNASVIWVMCARNVKTGETYECRTYDEIRSFFERNKDALFVGHNILRFDAPVLQPYALLREPNLAENFNQLHEQFGGDLHVSMTVGDHLVRETREVVKV